MEFEAFYIKNYRAIRNEITIDLSDKPLVPLVGINECGKTTILQAIYSFDYTNDKENEGKHLENTLNLYQTEEPDPIIRAKLRIRGDTLLNCLSDFTKTLQTKDPNETPPADLQKLNSIISEIVPKQRFIEMQRNLKSKKYAVGTTPYDALSEDTQHKLSLDIIRSLPYILYNDDFAERPITSLDIPPARPDRLSGWLSIYEKLFNMTKDSYSIFTLINEKDERRRESILSDVQEYLDKKLTDAWRTFNLGKKEDIYVKITLSPSTDTPAAPSKLSIRIMERIGDKERFFNVIDRSKGFLWFYNFVMKLQFNPKEAPSSRTIYLLDEPGSYLHPIAQEKLCSKIREISKSKGTVIYCTHSHHLLNPMEIPLSSIYIVEKRKDKSIAITPLPKVKTKAEKTHALQPIYEALNIPAFDFFRSTEPVLLLEGIYDT